MNNIRNIRESLGLTLKEVSKDIGVHFTTVSDWERGTKQPKPKNKIKLAESLKCTIEELFEDSTNGPYLWDELKEENDADLPPSPFAKHLGELSLGGKNVDCYVLDNGDRVISLTATVRALTDKTGGNLGEYIGVQSLKPYINKELVLGETVIFNIPGSPNQGKGITAEKFLDICNAYVQALQDGALHTQRQQEIAIQCSILLASCAKVGLIALIDEATGYQFERVENALQLKLKAFIADEMRAWEKTFPDELWEQFGRLTKWQGSLHSRPKWWGKLVMELIYNALDADVATFLKENKPPPVHRKNYHQWLSQHYGLKELITHIFEIVGVAKTCENIKELQQKVAHLYKKEPLQLHLYEKKLN